MPRRAARDKSRGGEKKRRREEEKKRRRHITEIGGKEMKEQEEMRQRRDITQGSWEGYPMVRTLVQENKSTTIKDRSIGKVIER